MKREIAAICAALLFLTSCSANGASTQEMPASLVDHSQTQKSTAQADTQDIVTLPSVVGGAETGCRRRAFRGKCFGFACSRNLYGRAV